MTTDTIECRFCGAKGSGKFCSQCGENYTVKRLTLSGILHDIFHFFTHFDKGFPFTLKRLLLAPGFMQKEYIDGYRAKYQKPFSMFFLCASFAALGLYWISLALTKLYHVGEDQEILFFNKYWVILQVSLMPIYVLVTYLFFINHKFNYAEIAVLQLYRFSLIFVVITIIHLIKFIFPEFQTRFIELPVILIYSILTNWNFFTAESKWIVVVKTIVTWLLSMVLAIVFQDLITKSLK